MVRGDVTSHDVTQKLLGNVEPLTQLSVIGGNGNQCGVCLFEYDIVIQMHSLLWWCGIGSCGAQIAQVHDINVNPTQTQKKHDLSRHHNQP